jgi:hypothetical protein
MELWENGLGHTNATQARIWDDRKYSRIENKDEAIL